MFAVMLLIATGGNTIVMWIVLGKFSPAIMVFPKKRKGKGTESNKINHFPPLMILFLDLFLFFSFFDNKMKTLTFCGTRGKWITGYEKNAT